MIKNKTNRVEIKLNGKFDKDVVEYSKNYGYSNLQELVKEAIREKIYGKNIKEQIAIEFMQEIEKEKSYIFKENKDLHEKLKEIAKRF